MALSSRAKSTLTRDVKPALKCISIDMKLFRVSFLSSLAIQCKCYYINLVAYKT